MVEGKPDTRPGLFGHAEQRFARWKATAPGSGRLINANLI